MRPLRPLTLTPRFEEKFEITESIVPYTSPKSGKVILRTAD